MAEAEVKDVYIHKTKRKEDREKVTETNTNKDDKPTHRPIDKQANQIKTKPKPTQTNQNQHKQSHSANLSQQSISVMILGAMGKDCVTCCWSKERNNSVRQS